MRRMLLGTLAMLWIAAPGDYVPGSYALAQEAEPGTMESIGDGINSMFESTETKYKRERSEADEKARQEQLERESRRREEIRRRVDELNQRERALRERERRVNRQAANPKGAAKTKEPELPSSAAPAKEPIDSEQSLGAESKTPEQDSFVAEPSP